MGRRSKRHGLLVREDYATLPGTEDANCFEPMMNTGPVRIQESNVMEKCLEVIRARTIFIKAQLLVPLIVVSFFARPALAQTGNMFIYPAKGQSQAQQNQDRYECHSWAVHQTGFDPTRTAPAAMPPPPPTTQYQPSRR